MSSSGSARRTIPEWLALAQGTAQSGSAQVIRSIMIRDSDSEPRSRSPHREATHVVPAAPCKNIAEPLQLVLMNRMGKLETFSEVRQEQINQLIDMVNDDQYQIGQLRDCHGQLDHDIDVIVAADEVQAQRVQYLEASSIQLKSDVGIAHELYTSMQESVDVHNQALEVHREQLNSHCSRFSRFEQKMTAMMSRIEKLEKENAELKVQLRQQ